MRPEGSSKSQRLLETVGEPCAEPRAVGSVAWIGVEPTAAAAYLLLREVEDDTDFEFFRSEALELRCLPCHAAHEVAHLGPRRRRARPHLDRLEAEPRGFHLQQCLHTGVEAPPQGRQTLVVPLEPIQA